MRIPLTPRRAGALVAVAVVLAASAAAVGPHAEPPARPLPAAQSGPQAGEVNTGADEDLPVGAARAGITAGKLPAKVNALTWNVCGASTSACGTRNEAAQEVDLVVNRAEGDPALVVIMLQEVCRGAHADALQKRLGNGWAVNFRPAPKTGAAAGEVHRCTVPAARNQEAGVLVALRRLPGSRITSANEAFTGVPAGDDRSGRPTQGAACLRDAVHRLMACSAHFPNKDEDERTGPPYDSRQACAERYGALGGTWQGKGWRTVLGGDLNLAGDSDRTHLKALYDGGNFEGDQRNRPTHDGFAWGDHKLDYLFFSDRGWRLEGAVVDSSPAVTRLSDHWLLKATVRTA
ncbi:endonuclease/exonuclease/phosphatase family protein [Kitasatospora sp. NPDC056327]|uniref:endonuclease/exonuclease/phosphatase family protein n=1 Tax=Kitasatospora sp. NPDC056327 TaxID=3345785 RepID=UPI0035D9A9AB